MVWFRWMSYSFVLNIGDESIFMISSIRNNLGTPVRQFNTVLTMNYSILILSFSLRSVFHSHLLFHTRRRKALVVPCNLFQDGTGLDDEEQEHDGMLVLDDMVLEHMVEDDPPRRIRQ